VLVVDADPDSDAAVSVRGLPQLAAASTKRALWPQLRRLRRALLGAAHRR
jgi:hypothetical protein